MSSLESEIIARMHAFHADVEGERLTAYLCPAGKLSIGRGHNCEAVPVPGVTRVGDRITSETMERLYREDCAAVLRLLDARLPWWRELETPRAAVLFDMCFNMGIGSAPLRDHTGAVTKPGRGLLSFEGTLRRIRAGQYAEAADNMRQSAWVKQTGRRAKTMIRQMETGQWQF